MSPFYAAYLRQLTPSKNYADGGAVSTQTAQPTAADAGRPKLGGPTTFQPQATTQGSGFGNFFTGNGVAQSSGVLGSKNSAASQALDYANQLNPLQAIGDMLTNKFQATAAPIQAGTNAEQLDTAYGQAQSGLEQQQALANQLGQAGGIENQANVYNQLNNIAQGQGPNPALEMLRQQTGNNMAAQASSLASQRGASANPAALARTIAGQGANIQQNAIGQGAALQAQQSQNALSSMGNVANTQVANQMAGVQGLNNATQNEQNILQGANSAYNANMVNQQAGINNVNAGVAAGNQNAMGQLFGGAMGGLSSAGGMFSSDKNAKENVADGNFDIDKFLDGLASKNMADGGMVEPLQMAAPSVGISGPQSLAGQWLSSSGNEAVSAAAPGFTAPAQTPWIPEAKKSSTKMPEAGGSASMAAGYKPTGGSNFLQAGIGLADGGEVEEAPEAPDVILPPPPIQNPVEQTAPAAQQVSAQDLNLGPAAQIAPAPANSSPWLNSTVADATSSSSPAFNAPAQTQWIQSQSGGGGGGGSMLSSGAGMMAMFSDEKGKKNVKSDGKDIDAMADKLSPKSFDYKNPNQPGAAPGRQFGVMAQDLEKSKAGASVVHDTPQGKMIDTNHAIGLLLASVGHLNEKIKQLEGHNKKIADGGKVDAMVSPGEDYLDKKAVAEVKRGKPAMSAGRTIPGKPKVNGAKDSYQNDTVSMRLEQGGIVIPRSITKSPNADAKAQAFVEAIFMGKPTLKRKGK